MREGEEPVPGRQNKEEIGVRPILVALIFTLAALSGLASWYLGQKLLHMAQTGLYSAGAGPTVTLLAWRKRAGLLTGVLILSGMVAGIFSQGIMLSHQARGGSATAVTVELPRADMLGEPGDQWVAHINGMMWHYLSRDGFVALRVDRWNASNMVIIAPDGSVVWDYDLGSGAGQTEIWLQPRDEALEIHIANQSKAGRNYSQDVLVSRAENGKWGEPTKIPRPDDLDLEPLIQTLYSDTPQHVHLDEEGQWAIHGYTVWLRSYNPHSSNYRSEIRLELRP